MNIVKETFPFPVYHLEENGPYVREKLELDTKLKTVAVCGRYKIISQLWVEVCNAKNKLFKTM